jgi:hypothetical protein
MLGGAKGAKYNRFVVAAKKRNFLAGKVEQSRVARFFVLQHTKMWENAFTK